eukprot:CAMPEP_0185740902 /NCGR_PEP_ID=MMETSP1171-20130828/38670_1 /TAXON_ID=374046 /ORGANISM="Helicotheca tamensis, Strain CCMP826" /LENGTH=216 /DNA_ID=CAMNT_0028412833 /DNA_START=66 /DNA_END=717 /DNA_ORIENTATION=-
MKLAVLTTLVAGAAAFTSNSPAAFRTKDTALFAGPFKSKVQYVPCISTEDLPEPGFATSGVAGGLAICIAVDEKGSVYALGDKCPPVNQPLSFGRVRGGCIEDPVLGTKLNLKTGEVEGSGAQVALENFLEDFLEDPVLGTKFNLKTGEVEGKWCPGGIGKLLGGLFEPSGVPVFPVKTGKGVVEVQVDVNAKANFESQYWSGVLDAQGKANGKYY